jgi:hypothetical protein
MKKHVSCAGEFGTKTEFGLNRNDVNAKVVRLREAGDRYEAKLRELERQFDAKARELSEEFLSAVDDLNGEE